MTKKLRTLIGSLIFGGLLIAACIKFIRRDINLDLSKTTQTTGKVVEIGIAEKSSRVGGKLNMKGKVFFLQLDNLKETLATYRPKQEYSALLNNIKIGDVVTVYYDPGSSGEFNLDVFQIEKDGKVLQDYQSYNKNHRFVAWMTGILGSIMIFFGIFGYYKGWN